MGNLKLEGKRIYLEPIIKRITPEALQIYLNDIEVTKYMYPVPYPYTIKDAEKYFDYLKSIEEDETNYELGIFDKKDDTFIGVIALKGINFNYQKGVIGYWIRKEFWKKGYGSEAASLVISYGFNELNLERISADLQKENTASLALLTSLNFTVEGLMRKNVKNKGVFVDRYVCALLKEEWERYRCM